MIACLGCSKNISTCGGCYLSFATEAFVDRYCYIRPPEPPPKLSWWGKFKIWLWRKLDE